MTIYRVYEVAGAPEGMAFTGSLRHARHVAREQARHHGLTATVTRLTFGPPTKALVISSLNLEIAATQSEDLEQYEGYDADGGDGAGHGKTWKVRCIRLSQTAPTTAD